MSLLTVVDQDILIHWMPFLWFLWEVANSEKFGNNINHCILSLEVSSWFNSISDTKANDE